MYVLHAYLKDTKDFVLAVMVNIKTVFSSSLFSSFCTSLCSWAIKSVDYKDITRKCYIMQTLKALDNITCFTKQFDSFVIHRIRSNHGLLFVSPVMLPSCIL